jgi:hypothetical protein
MAKEFSKRARNVEIRKQKLEILAFMLFSGISNDNVEATPRGCPVLGGCTEKGRHGGLPLLPACPG